MYSTVSLYREKLMTPDTYIAKFGIESSGDLQ